MKKILCSILVFVMIFAIVGCANTKGEVKLARRLSTNTNNLLQAINNLESVTNEDVAISDFLGENNSINNISYEINYNTPVKKVSKFKQIFGGGFIHEIKNVNTYRVPERYVKPISNNYQPYNYSNNDTVNYKAKYTTTNDNADNNALNNAFIELYKNKMESLYNACGDCLYVNTQCNSCKDELKTGIEECKSLCAKLNSGEIVLSESQLEECNSYCDEINNLCTKIKSCKGNCNTYLNTLKALKSYFGSNTESLTTNYLNLLDCLECRLGYYNQALNCVNKCNTLLKSCYKPTENNSNTNNIYNGNNGNNANTINNSNNNSNNTNNNTTNNNSNNTTNNNTTNNPNNTQINQPVTLPLINGNRPINNFGYNSNNGIYNNGIYNNGFGYGYGYNGINPYNPTPNNVNTYGPINRNVDTYNNVIKNTDTFGNSNNQNTINENNDTDNNTENSNEVNDNETRIEEKDHYQTRKIIKRPKYIKERDKKQYLNNTKIKKHDKISNNQKYEKHYEVEDKNKDVNETLENKENNQNTTENENIIQPRDIENNTLNIDKNINDNNNNNIATLEEKHEDNISNKTENENKIENEVEMNTNQYTKDIKTDENLRANHKNQLTKDIKSDPKISTEKNEEKIEKDGEKAEVKPISIEETKPTFLASNI